MERLFPSILQVDTSMLGIFRSDIKPVGNITSVNLFLKLLTNSIAGYAKRDLLNKPDSVIAELPATIVPNDDTFLMMVKYWKYVLPTSAHSPTERDELLASKAQMLVDQMLAARTTVITNSIPSATTFSILLELWTKVDPFRAVDTIECMLKLKLIPSPMDFAATMKALADIGKLNECEQLFYLHLSVVADSRSPDPTCCDVVLEAFSSPQAPKQLRDDPGERVSNLVTQIVAAGGKVTSTMVSLMCDLGFIYVGIS